MRSTLSAIAAGALAACSQPANQTAPANVEEANEVVQTAPPIAEPAANAVEAPRTSLPEPKGPIDPKSVEAAGQVVQSYGALIEQRRWSEAAKLWRDPAAAAAFAKQLGHTQTHLRIGDLGDTEGAAGSIYTTVPVAFYGDKFDKPAEIILRRVNDVPGSTEAQRRWHIERIEWKS